jgi:hypothetical protein
MWFVGYRHFGTYYLHLHLYPKYGDTDMMTIFSTTRCHKHADSNINSQYCEVQQTSLLPQLNAGDDFISLKRHRPLLYGKSCLPKIALRYYSSVLNMFKGVRWCPSAGCRSLSTAALRNATQRHSPLHSETRHTRNLPSHRRQLS